MMPRGLDVERLSQSREPAAAVVAGWRNICPAHCQSIAETPRSSSSCLDTGADVNARRPQLVYCPSPPQYYSTDRPRGTARRARGGEDNMIRSVLVAGGGSAGLLTALVVKKAVPHLPVTVVRSKEIGVIGVGESTT